MFPSSIDPFTKIQIKNVTYNNWQSGIEETRETWRSTTKNYLVYVTQMAKMAPFCTKMTLLVKCKRKKKNSVFLIFEGGRKWQIYRDIVNLLHDHIAKFVLSKEPGNCFLTDWEHQVVGTEKTLDCVVETE